MLSSKYIILGSMLAAMAAPAAVLAQPSVIITNGERAIEFLDPVVVTAPAQPDTLVANGVRYVGGEAVWVIDMPRYEFVGGKLVHAQDCSFKPTLASSFGHSKKSAPFDSVPIYTGA